MVRRDQLRIIDGRRSADVRRLARYRYAGAQLLVFVLLWILVAVEGAARQKRLIKLSRLVGGLNAPDNYRKGAVLIFRQLDGQVAVKHCTGSVIGRRHILTAAHCVVGYRRWRLGVFPGTHQGDEGEEVRTRLGIYVSKAYVHRWYGNFSSIDRRFDIAVLVLERKMYRGTWRRVRIGKQHSRRLPRGVFAIGYGQHGEYGRHAGSMHAVGLLIHRFRWCYNQELNRVELDSLDNNMKFCATAVDYPTGITDTCYGDSGGPLFEIDNGGHSLVQAGLTSFSFSKCGAPGGTPWYIRIWWFHKDLLELVRYGVYKGNFNKFVAVAATQKDAVFEQVRDKDGIDTEDADRRYGNKEDEQGLDVTVFAPIL